MRQIRPATSSIREAIKLDWREQNKRLRSMILRIKKVFLSMFKRKMIEPPQWQTAIHLERCPLCGRSIPPAQRDAHHLIPKMKGGKVTIAMHRICHRQVHALFSETELARQFNTPEALLAHADIQLFVDWIKNKPDDFFERVRRAARRR